MKSVSLCKADFTNTVCFSNYVIKIYAFTGNIFWRFPISEPTDTLYFLYPSLQTLLISYIGAYRHSIFPISESTDTHYFLYRNLQTLIISYNGAYRHYFP